MQQQIHLTELAGVDITAVNKEDLVDVSGLAFDNTVPREQRPAVSKESVCCFMLPKYLPALQAYLAKCNEAF